MLPGDFLEEWPSSMAVEPLAFDFVVHKDEVFGQREQPKPP
jgi:hypothetical protein